jgi:hypothetical protein
MAEKEDDKAIEQWQRNAERTVIFVGNLCLYLHTDSPTKLILQAALFSAAISVFLALTIPDLKQNPQDTSAFYLENIYELQFLAESNGALPLAPVKLPGFSRPKSKRNGQVDTSSSHSRRGPTPMTERVLVNSFLAASKIICSPGQSNFQWA